ncbi:hypothetical protein [Devosia sp.]|uniref:hypothetical protein n=1 Tax=Devosia sp. TaxID=1871048 RepID=UPI002AFF1865|nr:hypothetical protein [Devosia sp.]
MKLLPPQYVKPFVKRQKNDAADTEAMVIPAQRPEMRFVGPNTAEQQARAPLFRSQDRLVRQCLSQVNALRGLLYEFGYVVPDGPSISWIPLLSLRGHGGVEWRR